MKNVYACLLGNWVNLSTDDTATIGEDHVSANQLRRKCRNIFSISKRTEYILSVRLRPYPI